MRGARIEGLVKVLFVGKLQVQGLLTYLLIDSWPTVRLLQCGFFSCPSADLKHILLAPFSAVIKSFQLDPLGLTVGRKQD